MLWTILIAAHVAAGFVLFFFYFAYRSPTFAKYKIAADPQRSVSDKQAHRDALINITLSPALIFGLCYLFQDYLFYETQAPWWLMVGEGLLAYLVYDFAYYFLHRYPFHEWKLLRKQHAVHHAARHPTALDALMIHPYETVAGLLAFFASIAAVGGVHLYTFAVVFTIYTTLNVINHAGLALPWFPFRVLAKLSIKHDRHHHSMLSGNYASITPLPDMIFGTVE